MSNPKDFLARQIRLNTLILSGGTWAVDSNGGAPGLLIYSASIAPDFVGGRPDKLISGSGNYGLVQIYQSNTTPSGGFAISNTVGQNIRMYVGKAHTGANSNWGWPGVISMGSGSHTTDMVSFYSGSSLGPGVFILSQSLETGTSNAEKDPRLQTDVNFWVSGSKSNKGSSAHRGTAVFGGDLVVSGTLYAEKQVIEVDLSQAGGLYVSGSTEIQHGLILNKGNSTVATEWRNVDGNNFLYYAPNANSNNGFLGIGDYNWSSSNPPSGTLHVANDNATGNTAFAVLRLTKTTSGTPAVNHGVGMQFDVETTAGLHALGTVQVDATDVGSGTEDGAMIFKTMTGGAAATEKFRIGSDATVVNEGSLDHDFRVEGNSTTTLFKVNAGTDEVTIRGPADDTLVFKVQGHSDSGATNADFISIFPTEAIFNDDAQTVNFRVEGKNNTHAIFVSSEVASGHDQVMFLTSSAGAGDKTGTTMTDAVFIVSGAVGQRGVANTYGTAVFTGDLFVSGNISSAGAIGAWTDAGSFVYLSSNEHVVIGGSTVGAADIYLGNDGAAIFNEQGANADFRIEGDNDPNMFVVDASTDSIGINVAAGSHGAKVDILENDASSVGLKVTNNPGKDSAGGDIIQLVSGTLEVFSVGTSEIVIHEDAQSSGANTKSLRVESDADNYMFYVDGANNGVSIGTSAPSSSTKLHIGNGSASSAERVILMIENETAGALDAQITFAKQGSAVHCLGMDDSDSDKLKISTGGSLGAGVSLIDLPATAGGVIVFNEGAANVDLRVETQSDASAFLVDASENLVSIGSSGGQADFKVHTANEDEAIFVDASADAIYVNKGENAVTTTIHSTNDVAISVGSDGVVINEDGHATNDFRVESDSNQHAIFVDSGNNMLLFQTASYGGTDVSFYVSGSTDAKGTSTRGVAVFNGDVLISGSLYNSGSKRIDRAYGNVQVLDSGGSSEGICVANATQDTFKLKEGTGIGLTINAATDTITLSANIGTASPAFTDRGFQTGHVENHRGTSIICTSSIAFVSGNHIGGTSPVAYDASNAGQDVFFFVSGSVGGKAAAAAHRHGVALFGGDLVVSGTTHLIGSTINLGNHETDSIVFTGRATSNLLPKVDSSVNLGSPTRRWANIYTGDLHLRNDRGNWTIYEEPDMLVVVNNLTGKKYKMGLTPLEDDE